MARSSRRWSGCVLIVGVLYYLRDRPGSQGGRRRGRRRHRRGGHRLTSIRSSGTARRGERSPRRRTSAGALAMTDDDILRGPLRDDLVGAMQRIPEIAGRELTLDGAVGRDHEPQLPRDRGGNDRAMGHPPGRQRYVPPGDQPRGRTRRDGRRRGRRRRTRGDRVHPPRGLSRDALHRRFPGVRRVRPSTGDAASRGRLAAPYPRRAGHPGPVHPAPDRRGLSRAWPKPEASRSRPNTSWPPRSGVASSWPA